MKILFLTHYVWPHVGGVERHAMSVAKSVKRIANREVTILTTKHEKKLKNTEIKDDVEIVRFKYPHIKFIGLLYIWFWLFKNRKLIKNADIIHIHDVFIWYLPFRFIYPRKRVYLTFHGGQGKWPIPFKDKLLVKIAAKLSSGNICVGDFIPKYFGIKTNHVIYGGVERNEKRKSKKEKLMTSPTDDISASDAVIIFLGRLEKETGVYEFIEKIFTLRDKKYKNYKIEFVGDGSLRKACEKYGIVHGFCDPTPFLRKASICFASGYLSALEALNYGCELWTGSGTPIIKDYWKCFPYKKGDKLPSWKDVSKVYESLYSC